MLEKKKKEARPFAFTYSPLLHVEKSSSLGEELEKAIFYQVECRKVQASCHCPLTWRAKIRLILALNHISEQSAFVQNTI